MVFKKNKFIESISDDTHTELSTVPQRKPLVDIYLVESYKEYNYENTDRSYKEDESI